MKDQLQVKLDKLFDEQAAAELSGGNFDNKKIDKLSA
jgi:hypothetical protein